jgi:aminoglycoside phosphotransferase (APT) family kinase protein
MFFRNLNSTNPNTHDIILVDWQLYGLGDPATELSISSIT